MSPFSISLDTPATIDLATVLPLEQACLARGNPSDEPIGIERLWWRLAGLAKPAPKRWMDAYLTAFAISSNTRLVSLDQDFRQFLEAGLDLVLLEADGGPLSEPTDPPG